MKYRCRRIWIVLLIARIIERYQTVYAKDPGAVAAPTAGLHFDHEMLAETMAVGVKHAWVTLHVGAGTFQSLREEHIEREQVAQRARAGQRRMLRGDCEDQAAGGRVIAVGTTSVRRWNARRRWDYSAVRR